MANEMSSPKRPLSPRCKTSRRSRPPSRNAEPEQEGAEPPPPEGDEGEAPDGEAPPKPAEQPKFVPQDALHEERSAASSSRPKTGACPRSAPASMSGCASSRR